MIQAFLPAPASTVNLAVTGASARVAITSLGQIGNNTMRLTNYGSLPIFVELGDNTVTASASTGMIILPNAAVLVAYPPSVTNVAAIASAGGNTLYITVGIGV